jgi:hypothetical protein
MQVLLPTVGEFCSVRGADAHLVFEPAARSNLCVCAVLQRTSHLVFRAADARPVDQKNKFYTVEVCVFRVADARLVRTYGFPNTRQPAVMKSVKCVLFALLTRILAERMDCPSQGKLPLRSL